MIQCKTIVNEENFRLMMRQHCRTNKSIRMGKLIIYVLACIASALVLYMGMLLYRHRSVAPMVYWFILMVLLLAIIFLIWGAKSGIEKVIFLQAVQRRFNEKTVPTYEMNYSFTEEQVTIIASEGMSKFFWNAIESWVEDERYIIYTLLGSYSIIDKQGFKQEDLVKFNDLIEKVLKIQRIRVV